MKLQPLEEGPQRVKQQANAGGTGSVLQAGWRDSKGMSLPGLSQFMSLDQITFYICRREVFNSIHRSLLEEDNKSTNQTHTSHITEQSTAKRMGAKTSNTKRY